MKTTTIVLSLVSLGSSLGFAQDSFSWRSQSFWESAVVSNLNFFRNHAWDEGSGSYATQLNAQGQQTAPNRDVVALSRLIYGDATAPGGEQDLSRARRSAKFLLRHMSARDEHGLYFKSAVNAQGQELSSGRNYTFIFEQSYPITGLTALYAANPRANADLLPIIRDAAESFWQRFHDSEQGGLFYYYNFSVGDNSNDQGLTHKSYQSTVYPISSFLLALRKADPARASVYDARIRELLDIAVTRLVERRNGRATGWLIERTDSGFNADPSYTMSEAGHITQLAWVLGIAVRDGVVRDSQRQSLYLKTAQTLLSKFVENGGFGPLGTVYDAFDRTTGRPWADGGRVPTTAWWSNLEAIIAYAFASKYELLGSAQQDNVENILNNLSSAYNRYFIDHKLGGEFFRIDALSGEVVDSTKGGPGKSAYHIGEAYDYLFGQPALAH